MFRRKRKMLKALRPARENLTHEVQVTRGGARSAVKYLEGVSLKEWRDEKCPEGTDLSHAKKLKDKYTKRARGRVTWEGAVWAQREREMDRRQRQRDEYRAHYRPILSLTNLDPHKPYLDSKDPVLWMTKLLFDAMKWPT